MGKGREGGALVPNCLTDYSLSVDKHDCGSKKKGLPRVAIACDIAGRSLIAHLEVRLTPHTQIMQQVLCLSAPLHTVQHGFLDAK